MEGLETYRDLKAKLDSMTEEQLDQIAQIMISQADGDKPYPLHQVIDFGTVKHFCSTPDGEPVDTTRSCVDNEHHPEQFVLLCDYNMFAEDGAIAFDLETGERFYGKNKKKDVRDDKFGLE